MLWSLWRCLEPIKSQKECKTSLGEPQRGATAESAGRCSQRATAGCPQRSRRPLRVPQRSRAAGHLPRTAFWRDGAKKYGSGAESCSGVVQPAVSLGAESCSGHTTPHGFWTNEEKKIGATAGLCSGGHQPAANTRSGVWQRGWTPLCDLFLDDF